MKKRFLSMLLAVALILSLGVTSVMAAGEKFDAKNNVNIVFILQNVYQTIKFGILHISNTNVSDY